MLLLVGVSYAHNTHAQEYLNRRLTVQAENREIKKVLTEIEKATDVRFVYSSQVVATSQKVSLQLANVTLETALDKLLTPLNIHYELVGRKVVLSPRPTSSLPGSPLDGASTSGSAAPVQLVSGTVQDETGNGLPGVSVVVKGTQRGTTTNVEGKFQLEVPENTSVLVFSFVGYVTKEIVVGGQAVLAVQLTPEDKSLDEVVVVGYGTQKKANLTGSVSMVTSEVLENRPIASAGQGLQGVIPNLNISFRNGDPSASTTFNIRGFESINGGGPLILVDGVPMNIDRINPNDIASVNVLKDASAAAVYGARAAFGVILIETKRAKEGKVNVQLSYETSITKPIFHVNPVTDPYRLVTIWNDAFMLNRGSNRFSNEIVEGARKYSQNPTPENAWDVVNGSLFYYGYVNLQDEVIGNSPQHRYNMNISGGTKNASYYASVGYLDKHGYFKDKPNNLRYQRYNVLFKADLRVNDWLSLDPKIIVNADKNDQPHVYAGDVSLNTLVRTDPFRLVQFPDLPYYLEPGDRDKYEQYIGMYFQDARLLPYFKYGGRDTYNRFDTWLTQGMTLTPLPGLRIRGDFSYQYLNQMNQEVRSKVNMVNNNLLDMQIVHGFSAADWIRNRSSFNQYYVFNTYGEYTLDKLKNHYFKAMVGFNQEWGRNSFIQAQANNLATPNIVDLSSTTGTQQTNGGKSHISLRGAFYRLNYIFQDKYLLEANGRYDGSSRFPKESRMAFFPSFSAGWRISNEKFMRGSNRWLDNLMVRASYGTLGNQLLGDNYYAYINTMGMGQRNFIMSDGLIPYVSPAGLVSSQLTWETVVTRNLGLDLSMLNQRLGLTADIYSKDTKDMLMSQSYPSILGADAPDANAADLRTKGWELSLNWRDAIGKDWRYRFNLALADNVTTITKYHNPTGNINDYYVGKRIGEIWGFKTVGIFQTQDEVKAAPNQSQLGSAWLPGDIQYADLNGDGVITRGKNTLDDPGDQFIIGNSSARYSFGFTSDLSYKNWSLNLFFQGLFRDYFPPRSNHTNFWPWMADIVEEWWVTDSWSETNRDAYWPGVRPFRLVDTRRNFEPQTRYLQNASYVRLKNVTLSYTLPDHLTKKLKVLNRAQFYVSGMNLWEFTKMQKPLDPEQIYTLSQEYYLQRLYTVGVNLTF
ncbi:TonB-dependent receptor [Rhabdobacter roseus]|uniref:TonB-linked SusC/RagA family outer membrane protein n=1 Tax=Rhabdobacter roseus TaxID=1655419 RepID=A0A840TNR5_9BACT|nr:TonB-dependent receptor [Rhabdobacter roseus]MBB5284575.1 TonB-linked SusC/RagA family outer membrane protein [Rhabdobacter roseus]